MKKNLILILIAVILKNFLSNIPIFTIAATVLLIIACINLRKITKDTTYLTILIFVIVAGCIEFTSGIFFTSSLLNKTYDLFGYLSTHYNKDVELNEELLLIVSSFLETIITFLFILIIPVILWSLTKIKLAKTLPDLSHNDELKISLYKNGKKAAIFDMVSVLIAVIFIIIFFEVIINEAMLVASQEAFVPTYLFPLLLISIFVIIPLLIMLSIFALVYNIKFIVDIGKLLKEVKKESAILEDNYQGE